MWGCWGGAVKLTFTAEMIISNTAADDPGRATVASSMLTMRWGWNFEKSRAGEDSTGSN